MTIDDVKTVEVTGSLGDNGASYRMTFHVYFSGGYDAAQLLYNTDSDLPKRLDGYASDTSVYCSNVEVSLADNDGGVSTGIAIYQATFSPKQLTYAESPLDRPADIEWGGIDLTETVSTDINDLPIVNSAGDYYDPLPERPIRGSGVVITRNEAANPATVVTTYSNTTNSAAWHGVAEGNALMGQITATKQSEMVDGATVTYWRVSYPIRMRRNGWKLLLIDNGYRLKDADDNRQTITDDVGQQPVVPVLLDGAGGVLPTGGTPVVFPTSGYEITETANFGTLNLPNPFA